MARCANATGPLERHPTDKETAAAGTQETVTAGAVGATAGVAQPRLGPARATAAGSAFSSVPGVPSSGSGARSTRDIARPSDLLIVEAAKPQLPDPEIDGGELVLDDPRAWRSHAEIERMSSATGQEVEEASAATGQAVGGSTTSCAGLFRIFLNAAFKKEVKGEQFRALEKQWENVTLLIVDEVSLIGRAFFHRMHCRLQQAIGRSLPKEVSIRRNRQVSATSP